MASEDNNYTPEFKAKVALEALTQKKQNLDRLSDKYDVPVSKILTWTVQIEKNAAHVFSSVESKETEDQPSTEQEEVMEVDVSDEDVAESLSYGVMADNLNYKRLAFWSVLGVILVIIFVQALVEMYQYNTQVTRERISAQSEYYEVNRINNEAEETLSSFGVVDPEEGIYRIPIDSAMNEMAADTEN